MDLKGYLQLGYLVRNAYSFLIVSLQQENARKLNNAPVDYCLRMYPVDTLLLHSTCFEAGLKLC